MCKTDENKSIYIQVYVGKQGNISGDTEGQNNIKIGFSVTRYCRRCIPTCTAFRKVQTDVVTWANKMVSLYETT